MMLKLLPQGNPGTADVAQELLGKEIWVHWPHMVEAKVFEVWDEKRYIMCRSCTTCNCLILTTNDCFRYYFLTGGSSQQGKSSIKSEDHDDGKKNVFADTVKSITERLVNHSFRMWFHSPFPGFYFKSKTFNKIAISRVCKLSLIRIVKFSINSGTNLAGELRLALLK